MDDAHTKRLQFDNDIISVTGTCGKSTTIKILYDILKNYSTVDKTHKNSNSLLGIPWCINTYFNLKSKYWLIEIGISKKNEMKKLLGLVEPNIRILTNIGVAHTENFTNEQEYINEKLNFIENINDNTVLILNEYDKFIKNYKIKSNKQYKILTVGESNTDYVTLLSHTLNDDNISSCAEIQTQKGIIKIKYNGICKHTAINMCLAIAYATYINIPIDYIEKSLDSFKVYETRGNIVIRKKFILYDFTYNCNPTSIIGNLNAFKNIKSNNKLIILGDMYCIRNPNVYIKSILNICSNITINIATNSHIYEKKIKEKYSNINLLYSDNINNFKNILKNFINKNTNTLYIFIQALNSPYYKNFKDLSIFLNNF